MYCMQRTGCPLFQKILSRIFICKTALVDKDFVFHQSNRQTCSLPTQQQTKKLVLQTQDFSAITQLCVGSLHGSVEVGVWQTVGKEDGILDATLDVRHSLSCSGLHLYIRQSLSPPPLPPHHYSWLHLGRAVWGKEYCHFIGFIFLCVCMCVLLLLLKQDLITQSRLTLNFLCGLTWPLTADPLASASSPRAGWTGVCHLMCWLILFVSLLPSFLCILEFFLKK